MTLRDELYQQMIEAHARLSDDAIREALGQWISEVEPEIVRLQNGSSAIGAVGHGNPIIPIRPVDVYFTYKGKRV